MPEHENFEITLNVTNSGITIVSIKGQVSTRDARQLVIYFRELHSQGTRDVIVDLSELNYACSAALAFFISACGGYTKDGINFNAAFCGLHPNIYRTMESLGLAHLLRIAEDSNGAIKLLQGE